MCWVDSDILNRQFWFSNKSTDDIDYNKTFLHLIDSKKFEFLDYKYVDDEEEIMKTGEIFSSYQTEWEYKWEFIIPMKFLDSIDISEMENQRLIKEPYRDAYLNKIYYLQSFSWSFDFSYYITNFEKYVSVYLKLDFRVKYFCS